MLRHVYVLVGDVIEAHYGKPENREFGQYPESRAQTARYSNILIQPRKYRSASCKMYSLTVICAVLYFLSISKHSIGKEK